MPASRDQSPIPSEALRLAALGALAAGPRRYGEIAVEVRRFASRMLGPTLDVLGPSIEILRHEGLIEPIGPRTGPGQSMTGETMVRLTDAGRAEFKELLKTRLRGPMTDLAKMVVALKLRYLDQLDRDDRRAQLEMLIELSTAELARLRDLRHQHAADGDLFADWLAQDIAQSEQRLAWYRGKLAAL
jgi:DNA-binding PadR family transcriptional regulator